ncbi:MAG TPA: hypothetical protein VL172_23580, partial [Kofleriaceae bacterium]|nr:hypothetical protein [Kofleriaceae bacterium]
ACNCGGDTAAQFDAGPPDAEPPDAGGTWRDCDAGDQAFVRSAFLAVLGRRPRSQAEVDVYVDLIEAARARLATVPDGPQPRALAVRALARQPEYLDRWTEIVMDALKVTRIEDQEQWACYGKRFRSDDGGDLAAFVRDNPPAGGGDGAGRFSMLDLARSALQLDDLSPIYRGHLFALVSRAIPAANVPRVEAELARREDFGLVFDSAYLNRDIVCLGCHNSEDSITYNPDPELNRHFPIPGLFEKALYGDSFGIDPAVAHAPFRFDGFVADNGDDGDTVPWGWYNRCGGFYRSGLDSDPAGVDGMFAGLAGDRLTVFDLEGALAAGFTALRGGALQRQPDGSIADPDQAFAYLVAASIAEQVWREVVGTPLTIANYFPRNEAARNTLATLTDAFIASNYSLVELLVRITEMHYYNLQAPEEGCGDAPYSMPAIYDPWTKGDEDPARRGNGPGDAVAALSARTLLSAAESALQWPAGRFERFPQLPYEAPLCQPLGCSGMQSQCSSNNACCFSYDLYCANPPDPAEPTSTDERGFQRGIGVFLKNGERGFRGLDFQARLVWESRFGNCTHELAASDFIDELVDLAAARGGTVGDVAAAIKDRLIGEPALGTEAGPGGPSEAQAIEAIFGTTLDATATSAADLEGSARAFCGVLMSSPQFLLGGIAGRGASAPPALTTDAAGYPAVCAALSLPDGLAVTCADGSLMLP